MRSIVIPDDKSIDSHLRADEVAFPGGSLHGYSDYLLANDEDFVGGDKESKLLIRRMNRREKIKNRLAMFKSDL